MGTYFTASGYAVTSGGIVYASDLNNPLSALETSIDNLVDDVRTGSGITTVADTGAANAYVMTLDPAITAYSEGLEVWLKPANSNTGASTLNLNGLGVKSIRRFGLQALEAGDLTANYYTHLKYDGTYFQIVSTAGSSEAAAATSAAEALASAEDAEESATAAELSETNAASSAASINLPTINTGDSGKVLFVKAAEDGYELDSITTDYYVEVGTIRGWPTNTAPTGYLECDGSAISRATYSGLFAIIADTYGPGDGSTTFNLPDFRGEFLRGWDHAAGNDPDAASRTDSGDGTTGDHVGTKQDHQIDEHRHVHAQAWTGSSGGVVSGSAQDFNNASSTGGGNQYNTTYTGGNETRPRNVNVMWIIKY